MGEAAMRIGEVARRAGAFDDATLPAAGSGPLRTIVRTGARG
jgi:hypothetical protein